MNSWIESEVKRRHEDICSFVARDRLGRSPQDSRRNEIRIDFARMVRKFWDFVARRAVHQSRSGRGAFAILTPKGRWLPQSVSQDRPANRP